MGYVNKFRNKPGLGHVRNFRVLAFVGHRNEWNRGPVIAPLGHDRPARFHRTARLSFDPRRMIGGRMSHNKQRTGRDRRSESRFRINEAARLLTAGIDATVTILDISAIDLRVTSPGPIPRNTTV